MDHRRYCAIVLFLCATLLAALPAAAAWPPASPAQLVMTVRDTAGIARSGEVLSSGVPLARSLAITSTAGLAVVDSGGSPLPAEFRVLGRWFADPDDSGAPIQWLLVSFPATVSANGSASYRLVVDGSVVNPPPAVPLEVTQAGNQVTVDTGAATFVLGGNAHTLFEEVRSSTGTLLAGGGALEAVHNATTYSHNTLRAVEVVWSGPLTAVVQVRGTYSMPAVGGGLLASTRRYVFRAGAPAAQVRHSLAWEGALCPQGELVCPAVNGLLLASARDRLSLSIASPYTVQVVGDRELPALTGFINEAQSAAVRQTQRLSRLADPHFEAFASGPSTTSGEFADGAMLSTSGTGGAVAIGLRDMHLYEPQALWQNVGGFLSINLVESPVHLGARQGMFANFAVAAFGSNPTRATLDQHVWAPLNRPLRAWPSAAWWASSRAVEEFPVGNLPADLASYDVKVPAILEKTEDHVLELGLQGLMTHGLWPRYWGDPLLSDEVGCGDNDPTPANDSDDVYWCSTWADYHNAGATAPIWAFRSGQVEWLDKIAAPAAWRMLHTVIQQCAPGDAFFYCGQAPTGYGGYRADNNGSHAYFDNLLLHYWLTGDETVIQTLTPGARTMRGYLCPGRANQPPDPMCTPTDLIDDAWAGLNGRGPSQWYRAFRFLGLASDDTYLDDWQGNMGRWFTQYWAQPGAGAATRGFTVPSGGGVFDYVDGPGTYTTDQLWMASLYDFDVLERLAVDSQDAPIGSPALAPSAAQIAWARSLAQIGSATPWSTGTPNGPWPNVVSFTFSGNRVGGTLTALDANHIDSDGDGTPCELCDDDGDDIPETCADVCLYEEGKSPLGAVLARAGDAAQDNALATLGRQFAVHGLNALGNTPQPLNKKMGIGLSRLHAAIARATLGIPETPMFADGFEVGSTAAWSNTSP
jgi:hypothetical protein